MYKKLKPILEAELAAAKENGTYKVERVLESAQGREITVRGKKSAPSIALPATVTAQRTVVLPNFTTTEPLA